MVDELRQLTQGLGPSFATLEARTRVMMELSEQVRAALTGDEKAHVISASYRGSTLIVIADSAAWSTHIRYAQEQLLERVRGPSDMRFDKLRVRVGRPPSDPVSNESAGRR
jgi:hypothetical protein